MTRFEKRTQISVPSRELFDWHARPGAFERLAPPWQRVEVASREGTIRDGDRTVIKMYQGPIALRWVAEHMGYQEGVGFEDRQVEGPFRHWHHRHHFEPQGEHSSWLRDEIDYEPPLGALGGAFAGGKIRSDLARTFRYRHDVTRQDLEQHARYRDRRPLTVAITGASGLVGTALSALLTTGGHRVLSLVRRSALGEDEVEWSPTAGLRDLDPIEGIDAVVHLAGENIGAGRWTRQRRRAILESRVEGTRALVESLSRASRPPRVFLAASAVGFYGNTERAVTEEGPSGDGFLAEVCRAWEAEAARASAFAERVVLARLGVVLSPRGGALGKMLLPFRVGGGGPVGSGRQQISWISIDDAAGALLHALQSADLAGPVNVTSPTPITNLEFTRVLGRVLRRPTLIPLPAFAVRALFGEMGEETLLASTGALPARLSADGYTYRWPTVEGALAHLLGR